jgi:hypothetical protein
MDHAVADDKRGSHLALTLRGWIGWPAGRNESVCPQP